MTDKELVGEKVVSTMYGEGEIINVFPEKVEIRFPVKITQFIWVAFSKTLRAVRENVQEYILAKLNFITTNKTIIQHRKLPIVRIAFLLYSFSASFKHVFISAAKAVFSFFL